jgi:formamidopyrimidine-DNA glycosylase
MPELPEVETVRRRLEPRLVGRTVRWARIDDERLVRPEPADVIAARLEGVRIDRLERRGKHLLVRLDDGATLAVHLRMTGNLIHGADPATLAHVRAVLELDDGTLLVYTDLRRFGTWTVLEGDLEADAYLDERLGVEPLDGAFDGRALKRAFAGRRAPVKALLLDQHVVAGVGNIYADEALHRARIHPLVPAGTIAGPRLTALAEAVKVVLELGIAAQGASISDYRLPDGGFGSMQERFRVFDRQGEPCPECGRTIVKLRVAGRGTHVCPGCQRTPRVTR